jgi:membrane protein
LATLIGPITFVRRVAARLSNVGWARASGSLAFTTLLGLVPLVTVAFAFVAQFPVFQDFLRVLEAFLLRYMLPESASAIVHRYVLGLATEAASVKGVGIVFVVVTATLVVAMVEDEINVIWGIRQKRPLLRRVLVYVAGLTAGPVLVGAAITFIMWGLQNTVVRAPLQDHTINAILGPIPFLFTAAGFTALYALAPARKVPWFNAVVSGVLATAAFEAVKTGFAWYVENVAGYELMYGALAAFPVFLMWIFLFWMIVLAGAAVTAALTDGGGKNRG